MNQNTKNCPKCDAEMSMRIGIWKCPSCGHEMSSQSTLLKQRPGTSTAGDGEDAGVRGRARAEYDPGAKYRQNKAPAPPPAESLLGQDKDIYGTKERNYELSDDPRRMEKYIFLGVYLVANGAMAVMPSSNPAFSESSSPLWAFIGGVVGSVFSAFIYSLALFMRESFLKWSCMLLTGLSVFGFISGASLPVSMGLGGLGIPPAYFIINAAIFIWLVTILYRDIASNPEA